jgi:anti-sigma B factor antagonist
MNVQLSDCLLELQTREDAIIARFTRPVSLCGQVADSAAEQLASLLTETGRRRLLIDFGNVESLTSFMLGKLVTLNRKAESAGRRVVLFNVTHYVHQILEVSRLTLLLSLVENESAALAAS